MDRHIKQERTLPQTSIKQEPVSPDRPVKRERHSPERAAVKRERHSPVRDRHIKRERRSPDRAQIKRERRSPRPREVDTQGKWSPGERVERDRDSRRHRDHRNPHQTNHDRYKVHGIVLQGVAHVVTP